ncbi:MAG: PAS domain S-box protein [Desulfobulbus sp.]|nr:PAS domain S-box protein [Desulfobulbus sp.]
MITPKPSPLLYLACLIAGILANQLPFTLFFNIDLLFGSIFALLTLRIFGLPLGCLAATLIALPTYFLWHHPFALLIMSAEAIVAGWLHRRYQLSLLFADTLYWLLLGLPLVYTFYGLVMAASTSSTITMTKQATNGIANALIADLLFYSWLAFFRREKLALREMPANLLAAFALLPTLLIFMCTARQDYAHAKLIARDELVSHSRQMEQALSQWLQDRRLSLVRLSQHERGAPGSRLQQAIEWLLLTDKNFERICAVDEHNRAIAMAPKYDQPGQPLIGDVVPPFAEIETLKTSRAPQLTGVVWRRVGEPKPVVLNVVPLAAENAYQGYIGGRIQLNKLAPLLDTLCPAALQYTLLDQAQRVVISNRPQRRLMAPYQRGPGHLELTEIDLMLWVPEAAPNKPYSERWRSAVFFKQLPIHATPGWTLLVENPVSKLQNELYSRYGLKFTLLFVAVLFCLAGSALINRRIIATLAELSTWTGNLSRQIQDAQPPAPCPSSRWREVSQLIDQFHHMATELKIQFAAAQKMNLLLEQRVKERTNALQVSRDLLQHLTEAVPVGIFHADQNGQITFCNAKLGELHGLDPQKILAEAWMSSVHPEDQDRIRNSWTTNISAASPFFSDEFRLLAPDGQIHWVCGIAKRLELSSEQAPRYIGCVVDVTENKASELALREHSVNLGNLIETTNDLVVVTDPGGRILFFNQAVHLALGYRQTQLATLRLNDLYTAENVSLLNTQLASLLQGKPLSNRLPLQTAAGAVFPVSARLSRGTWNDKNCYFFFFKDLRQEEEARRLFQRLFHNNPTLMALTSLPDRRLIDVNAAFERTLGYSREEAIGKTAIELGLFIYPEQRQAALQLLHGQESLNGMMMQIRCKNGVIVDGLFSGEKILSEGHEYWLSVMVDITPWKLAQEALQRRESYLTAIIESQPGLVWLKDEASRFLTVNTAFSRACGKRTPDQVVGKLDFDLWPRELAAAYRDDDLRVIENGASLMIEEAIADQGELKWFETFKTPIFDNLNRVIGTAGYARDITERRQAETDLRESRERLLTATSAAQLGVYSYDFITDEIYYSPQFLSHYGLPPDSMLELDDDLVPKALHPEDKPEFFRRMIAANTPGGDGIFEHEFRIIRVDGAIRWLRVVGQTLFSDETNSSHPLRSSGIIQDLSERKKMEQALRTSQEQALAANAEKTTLLSTVAHEFRTPLSLLSSSLDILERYDARLSDEQRQTQKNYLRNAVNQLKHLVDTTLAFNRTGGTPPVIKTSTVDLAELCPTICREIRLVWSQEHDFLMDISPKVGSMLLDESLFRRIVENLLTNAFLYTPPGGQIRFSVNSRNTHLSIEVADQGVGISDADLPHIFNAYYRGDNIGPARGMGLGLNIVRTTVERLGGRISLTSQLHRGTTFRVELPLEPWIDS